MRVLLILYWFISYTVMSMALVVAIGRAILLKTEVEKRHCVLLLSFSLLMLAATLRNIIPGLSGAAANALSYAGVAAICLAMYAVPGLALSLALPADRPKKGERLLPVIAVACLAAVTAVWNRPFGGVMILVSYGVLITLIAATLAQGAIARRANERRGISLMALDPFWGSVMRITSRASLIALPLIIFLDLVYPILRPAPSRIHCFPLLFVVWSVTVLWQTLKQALANRASAKSQPPQGGLVLSDERMGAVGLSKREKEVAILLASGLSYKEIAVKLFVSEATVKTHVARIYTKTGASSKLDAVKRLNGN